MTTDKPNIEELGSSTGKPGASPASLLIDQILERAARTSAVFINKNVLSMDYIPDYLPFRDKQIAEVASTLSPILKKERCSNLFLYGKPGTGKTVVARFVLRRLAAKAVSLGLQDVFVYVNTRLSGTAYRVVWELAHQLGLSLPFTGLSIPEMMRRIYGHIARQNTRVIIVLDEIDFLVKHFGDDLLYELTRARLDTGEYAGSAYTIVGISNDLMFKEVLDPRVLSTLAEEEIVFPPYTAQELGEILRERARIAFKSGAISDAAINLCAALSGSEHGDARRAVELLRVAGEIAERAGASQVTEEHVQQASIRIESDRLQDAVSTLPLHAKLLLLSSLRLQNATTGQVYRKYEKLCEACGASPVTPRRATGILSELDALGLLHAELISSGRYGRTKRIKTQDSERLLSILAADPILKDLVSSEG